MSSAVRSTVAAWESIGAYFDSGERPPAGAIDLERLLLDTARHCHEMSRLFVVAATWLHLYGSMVAKHRLKRLIDEELEGEFRPVLGLLLETAQRGTHPPEFASVLRSLRTAVPPRPLFRASQSSPALAALARDRASDLSRKWGVWAQPIEFKHDAVRPAEWILRHRPELRTQADFLGDLRASVLAALRHDAPAEQEHDKAAIARLAGGSRSQVNNALRSLELTGRVAIRPSARANRHLVALRER